VKVAVSALGTGIDDKVDERFGRAQNLLVVDCETLRVECIDNKKNRDALQGAGIGAAELVSDSGAEAVITGHLGPKAHRALSMVGIDGYAGGGMTVREAIAAYNDGALSPLDIGEAHAGLS
jgi:predicted Fe-Mo cluster-binding NifX family protein